jgi:hypothetical protein
MLIDDRTRDRIVWVIFLLFMISALGIKNWVLGALIVALVAAPLIVGVWRWNERREADEAARRAARKRILKRMQAQHRQAVAGDERGVYGRGYKDHVAYRDATQPRMPRDDENPRPKPGKGVT